MTRIPNSQKKCIAEGCDRFQHGKGLCKMHHKRTLPVNLEAKARHAKTHYEKNKDSYKKRNAKSYKNNRIEAIEKSKANYKKNKVRKKAYNREYGQNNKESILVNKREYRSTRKEKLAADNKVCREENYEKIEAQREEYNRVNRDEIRTRDINRIAKRRLAEGSHTTAEWKARKDEFNNTCPGCGDSDVLLTRDHVVSLHTGGTNYIDNIFPLCRRCNSSKFTKYMKYDPWPVGQPPSGRWDAHKTKSKKERKRKKADPATEEVLTTADE